jgi:hypothetical protein
MMVRMRVLLLLVLLSTSLAIAGNKNKPLLPAYVLKARTVAVLIDPNAGTSVTSPLANSQRSSCGCATDRQWHPTWRTEGRSPDSTQPTPQDTSPPPELRLGLPKTCLSYMKAT